MKNPLDGRLRRLCLDMHLPEWHPEVLSEFDPEQIVAQMQKARVNVVMLWCKDHFGLSFYPTKVGKFHPLLKGRDLVSELVQECKQADISAVAYYSVGVDGEVCANNPDWITRTSDGEPVMRMGGTLDWGWPCINTPYREYVLSQLEEIISWYDFVGLELDMLYYRVPACYCETCQRLFRERTGLDIPREYQFGSREWQLWQDFRCRSWETFMREARDLVKSIKPQVQLSHNYHAIRMHGYYPWIVGSRWQIERYDDYLSGETGPGHLHISYVSRAMRGAGDGKPFEAIPYTGAPSIDWGLRPVEELTGHAMTILGNGGAVFINNHLAPQGWVQKVLYDRLEKVFARVERVEEYAEDLEPVRHVALVHSERTKEVYANDHPERYALGLLGAFKMLLEAHIPFDVLMQEQLTPERLAQYKLLVLPNCAILDRETAAVIDQAFAQGLGVISSFETSLYEPDLKLRDSFALDCIGAALLDDVPYSCTFIHFDETSGHPLLKDVTKGFPIPLRHRALKVTCNGDGVGNIVYPMTENSPTRHITHVGYPPPGHVSRYPAVVLHEGGGRSVYFPGRVFAAYAEHSWPELRQLVHNAMAHAGGEPPFRVEAPKSVEVTFNRQEEQGRWVVHLINLPSEVGRHCRTDTLADPIHGLQLVDEVIPIHGVRISVSREVPGGISTAWSLEHGTLEVEEVGDRLVVTLPCLDIHDVVTLR